MAKKQPVETVNEYIQRLDHPLKPAIEVIRAMLLSASPEIGEEIKWNSPGFYAGDSSRHFATVNINLRTARDSVLIIFHQGAKVKDKSQPGPAINDPGGLLEWLGKERCAAKFHDVKEVRAKKSALQDIVRQWIIQL